MNQAEITVVLPNRAVYEKQTRIWRNSVVNIGAILKLAEQSRAEQSRARKVCVTHFFSYTTTKADVAEN